MSASDQKKYEECECSKFMLSVQDTLDVLNGKWKLPILTALKLGSKRFKEIAKATNGITDKMLAKELKEMEANQLVTRTVHEAFPPKVEYSITEHALSLDSVFISLRNWGNNHRKKIMGSDLTQPKPSSHIRNPDASRLGLKNNDHKNPQRKLL